MFGWPVGLILLDSAFAVAMWICLSRFFLGIALHDNSGFIVMRWLVQASTPIINIGNRVCPREVPEKLRSLYSGFVLLVIRFYFIPMITGYGVNGINDFPLEKTIIGLF